MVFDWLLTLWARLWSWPPLACTLRQDTVALHTDYPLAMAATSSGRMAAEQFPGMADRLRVLVGTSLAELESRAEWAWPDTPYDALGYALERTSPDAEWQDVVASVSLARQIAATYNVDLLLGLGGRLADDVRDLWPQLAPMVDYWLVQAQRQQAEPAGWQFRREVRDRVQALKRIDRELPIIVQVSVTPGPDTLTADEVLRYVGALRGLPIMAVNVFDGMDERRPETVREMCEVVYR